MVSKIEQIKADFEIAMDDDFNTANAIAAIIRTIQISKRLFKRKNTTREVLQAFINI